MSYPNQVLEEFIQSSLSDIEKQFDFDLHALTKLYLINLCVKGMKSNNIIDFCAQTGEEKPLADMLAEAYAQASEFERMQKLIALGDRSLYIAGFFSDWFKSRLYDLDYYINMGSMAYNKASHLQGKLLKVKDFRVFEQLSYKFKALVDVLMALSESINLSDAEDLLAMFDKWLASGSERLLRKMELRGLLIQRPKTKIIH